VIVCQNNQWAISTPAARQTASVTFAAKAKAYGMPGIRVDGNDVLAVYRAVTEARVRAVAGAGPTFLECVTYRMSPHATTGDSELPEADIPPEVAHDPIERFRRHLEYLGTIDPAADKLLGETLDREIAEAIATAAAESPPERSTLFDDVYAERPWHLVEEAAQLSHDPGME
jgi:pyruvate dehydrogenase E1 component alpha subunit/2-oxoisovalerate dehydrogenase E1 component alpha subunit